MPDIKLYDYQRGPVPEGTKTTCYWTPPKKKSTIVHSRAPWEDAPMMAGFYDENDNLIGVRFVRKDGTYDEFAMGQELDEFAEAIEAKLKEKNAKAQPAVPDAIGPNEDELPSYAAGWNDCRALMLEMRKP